MTENEFMLQDRIAKIKSINKQYDLENNAYVSFSGGKDSTILHYLLDLALPGNKIPRLFLNTGIEYIYIFNFVKELAKKDDRIKILNVGKNIKETLKKVGYPFKSKEHSQKVYEYRKGYRNKSTLRYFRKIEGGFQPCPNKLLYQINDNFQLKISHLCCFEFKKKPAHQWSVENKRPVVITGMKREEGNARKNLNCILTNSNGELKKFHPLAVVNKEFENWFIESRNIKLCELYYPPFNFERTGCKGCPFALNLQEQLMVMENLLPAERKQCEMIWKPIYDEYRRIGYRLEKEDEFKLFNI